MQHGVLYAKERIFVVTIGAEYLAELGKTIRLRCQCTPTHRQTISVHEKTEDNETIWFGDVEVFDLTDCKHASRCYAWQDIRDALRIVTVLHSKIVDSARRAVQVAIFTGVQPPMLASADLEAVMQKMRQTAASICRKRQ